MGIDLTCPTCGMVIRRESDTTTVGKALADLLRGFDGALTVKVGHYCPRGRVTDRVTYAKASFAR